MEGPIGLPEDPDWDAPEGSWASSAAIRKTMTSTRGRDTEPELAVRSAVHRRGLRYRVDTAPVKGLRRRADLVFPTEKVAVFVDGCWWHGCPEHGSTPQTNAGFWREKIAANKQRDRETNGRLIEVGWSVVRVWEHEEPELAAERIEHAVRERRVS